MPAARSPMSAPSAIGSARPWTTAPPTSGPAATDRPVMALNSPMAAPRRSAGNAALSNVRPTGTTRAAPAPCSTRAATNQPTLGARALAAEARAKMARPAA